MSGGRLGGGRRGGCSSSDVRVGRGNMRGTFGDRRSNSVGDVRGASGGDTRGRARWSVGNVSGGGRTVGSVASDGGGSVGRGVSNGGGGSTSVGSGGRMGVSTGASAGGRTIGGTGVGGSSSMSGRSRSISGGVNFAGGVSSAGGASTGGSRGGVGGRRGGAINSIGGRSVAGGSAGAGSRSAAGGSHSGANLTGDMTDQSDDDYHLSEDSYYGSSENTSSEDTGTENNDDYDAADLFDDFDIGGDNSGGAGGSNSGGVGGSNSGGAGGSGVGEEGDNNGSEGDDGSEGDEEDVEEAEHARRGYSVGIYGIPPRRPIRIRMLGRVIDSPTACRTLLALMRVHWPAGCIGTKDIDRRFPRWWRFIRDEFFRYYEFNPEHGTLEDAREAVRHHMRNNMRKTLCNERIRVQKIIDENGGSFIDHRPAYLSEDVWKAFCEHWDSPEFRRRSDAARAARQRQNNPHTSGAISFQRRAWDIRDKEGEEPARYDLYIRMHTKKDSKELTSQVVRDVVDKYLSLCNTLNIDPNQAPIGTWAEAVGVRKNSILGVPRTRASDLIPLPPTSSRRRRRRVDDEGRSIVDYLADDLVLQAVDRTVAYASAHPEQFNLGSDQVRTLAESVVDGVTDLPEDHPLSMRTMRELVKVMVSVLADIKASPRPTTKDKGKGKMNVREDHHSSSDSDDGPRAPPSPPSGRRRAGIHIRGD